MRTPAQREAARINGAKSQGPVSRIGKLVSSRNAITHGLSADKMIVVEGESTEKWHALLDACHREFQPETDLERELVTEIAAARWRLRRAWTVETSLFDMGVARSLDAGKPAFEGQDYPLHHAAAVLELGAGMQLMDRYETRLRRSYDRAVANLQHLRERRRRKALEEMAG